MKPPTPPPSAFLALRRWLVAGVLLATLACPALHADTVSRHFDIEAGPADRTLKLFSQQAGVELAFATDAVKDIQTQAVRGDYAPVDALQAMLLGTPLVVVSDSKPGAFAVRRETAEEKKGEGPLPTTPGVGPRPEQGEVVRLDPFEILADRSNSYSTLNSNSITRFNVELDKMPLSADIFDQAFMNDVGATSVEAMLQTYSAGAGFSGSDPGSTAQAEPGDHTSHSYMQLRGFGSLYMQRDSLMPMGSFYNPGSTGSNYSSNFDIERVEVINGPQAMLYSGGGGGGVINVVSKQARLDQPASGSLKFQVDQYGSKLGQLDYGVGDDHLAVRVAILQEDQATRRVDLGGSIEGYYAQIAVKPLANTTIRVTAEQTTFNDIQSTDPSLTAPTTDSRNGDSLRYLLASGQAGASGGPAGALDNGFLNWSNVDSYGGNVNEELTIDTFATLAVDTQWSSWLSSQVAVGYNDFYLDLASTTPSIYAPGGKSNPLPGWTAAATPSDETEPGRGKAIRGVLLATNDFFQGRVHSQTILGADYLRQDAAQLDYGYYQADSNFNVITSAAITTNNGRTALTKQSWPIDNGFLPDVFYGPRTQRITVGGVNYVRMLENIINPALISPSDPAGLSNSNTYEISKAMNSGLFFVNNTQWWGGKLDTLIGIRHANFFSEDLDSGTKLVTLKGFDYDVGADYGLLSWLRAYVTASSTYDPPEQLGWSPEGTAPGVGHSTGQEVGLKVNTADGSLSGSLSLYHADGQNEQYEVAKSIANDIAPSGLNGTPSPSGRILDLDRTSMGMQVILTANPTPNLRLRFSADDNQGKILNTVSSPQTYSDQFHENSQGQVTYADGTVVYVPPTFNSKAPTTTATTAGAVPLTVALMNNPSSVYYANPVNPTGQINASSAVATVLKTVDPTHGSILTGAVGLPISDIQITTPFALPGSIPDAYAGDKTLGYPRLSANLTAIYTVRDGWLKGASIGGTVSVAADYGLYYYFPAGVTNSLQRIIFSAPDMGRLDLILGYSRKFRRTTWSTQLNVYNLFNHYDVLIFPDEVTGWSVANNLSAYFFGQPRSYQWTNTISF